MRFLSVISASPDHLAYLGSGLLYFCRSLALTSPNAGLRSQAIYLGHLGFQAWKANCGTLPARPDADTIGEFVRGYGAAESIGLRSNRLKGRLAVEAKRFGAGDFLGFDVRQPPPHDVPEACECGTWNIRRKRICANPNCRAPLQRMTVWKTWSLALTAAYCGERYGVPLGARYRDVLRWLPTMRPYRLSAQRFHREFYDAAYAVTHVVYTLNDYGRFLLDANWLPWEYEFLRTHLETAFDLDDPDMVGEFVDTIRAFGVPDSDPQVCRGFTYLLDSQNRDGSWGTWDGNSLYVGFHATWAAIDGLRDFAWTGPTLLFPELKPSLERWARTRY